MLTDDIAMEVAARGVTSSSHVDVQVAYRWASSVARTHGRQALSFSTPSTRYSDPALRALHSSQDLPPTTLVAARDAWTSGSRPAARKGDRAHEGEVHGAVFVIPAYNEEANVPRLLADLEGRPELWADGGYVILVDDGSTDGTVEAARAHDGDLPVQVLVAERNEGPGKAFDRGFRRALNFAGEDELIVTLESDTTSDLDALEAMLAAAREGADVVLASHHKGGELVGVSAHRRWLSRAASSVIRRGGGLDAATVSSFFRVYRASALNNGYERYGDNFIRERGFACKAEILMKLSRLGITIVEVPVTLDWGKREGESKVKVPRLPPLLVDHRSLVQLFRAQQSRGH